MTTSADQIMRKVLSDHHDRLSASLDVAAKVHMLLPEGLTLAEWCALPGELRGQLSHADDASALAEIVAVSRIPGWSFECGQPKDSNFRRGIYMTIAAVTEVDGVAVRIWCQINADVVVSEGVVAA